MSSARSTPVDSRSATPRRTPPVDRSCPRALVAPGRVSWYAKTPLIWFCILGQLHRRIAATPPKAGRGSRDLDRDDVAAGAQRPRRVDRPVLEVPLVGSQGDAVGEDLGVVVDHVEVEDGARRGCGRRVRLPVQRAAKPDGPAVVEPGVRDRRARARRARCPRRAGARPWPSVGTVCVPRRNQFDGRLITGQFASSMHRPRPCSLRRCTGGTSSRRRGRFERGGPRTPSRR